MLDRFVAYLSRLEDLSTEQLDRSAEKLVRAEKHNAALVIAHIAEMSRRKGALERGYKNLFDYCVRRLHLSEGSVALRIQVAYVSRRFPKILVALAENRISLTVAGLLAPHLTEENVDKLLADGAGMTKREAEEYLVRLQRKPIFSPTIRRTPPPPEGRAPSSSESVKPAASTEATPPTGEPERPGSPQKQASASILRPATPEVFNFRFAANREFKEKFERLAEVLGVENPLRRMAEILEVAVDTALDKKDSKRKYERRLHKQKKDGGETSQPKPRPDEVSETGPTDPSRYIPSAVRERVHARAGLQCEYRGPDGTRCRSRTGLEIEHERPFALHRSHDERYLRLFCPAHNRLSAERVYGAAFIEAKIATAPTKPP